MTDRAKRWEKAFLDAFRVVPNVSLACRAAGGIRRQGVYEWAAKSPRFKTLMEDAKEEAIGALASAAHRVALDDEDPQMIRWLLSRLAPEEYGDKTKLEHSGTVGVRTMLDVVRDMQAEDTA